MSTSQSKRPSKPDGPTGKLCSWVASTDLADMPKTIRTRAKYLILDGIGCALVGAHLPESHIAGNAIFGMEPQGDCTVIGWGSDHRLSPIASTLLNSTFIQGFELDDYHRKAPLHSNSLLIPALLAASKANSVPAPVTGADFLRAYIVGCEIGPRIGLALHGADLLSRGWHSGAIQGPSAVAAAVSSLLHLPANAIEDALGLACTQAGGLMSAQFGSMGKRMQHGFASRNGLLGALLAQGGYTGIKNVYEQPYGGFLSCFSQGANFEPKSLPEEICKGLGSEWETEGVTLKSHACMAALHGTVDCVAHLQQRHPDRFKGLAQIKKIETRHGRAAYEHGGWKSERGKPLTSTAAQMSIQYAAAVQLVDREVLMAQFSAEKLNREQVVDLMQKVEPVHDVSFDVSKKDGFKTVVKIAFADGEAVEEAVQAPKGVDPPLSNEDVVVKFRSLAKMVVDQERMRKIEDCVLSLDEGEGRVEELCALLEPAVGKAIEA